MSDTRYKTHQMQRLSGTNLPKQYFNVMLQYLSDLLLRYLISLEGNLVLRQTLCSIKSRWKWTVHHRGHEARRSVNYWREWWVAQLEYCGVGERTIIWLLLYRRYYALSSRAGNLMVTVFLAVVIYGYSLPVKYQMTWHIPAYNKLIPQYLRN